MPDNECEETGMSSHGQGKEKELGEGTMLSSTSRWIKYFFGVSVHGCTSSVRVATHSLSMLRDWETKNRKSEFAGSVVASDVLNMASRDHIINLSETDYPLVTNQQIHNTLRKITNFTEWNQWHRPQPPNASSQDRVHEIRPGRDQMKPRRHLERTQRGKTVPYGGKSYFEEVPRLSNGYGKQWGFQNGMEGNSNRMEVRRTTESMKVERKWSDRRNHRLLKFNGPHLWKLNIQRFTRIAHEKVRRDSAGLDKEKSNAGKLYCNGTDGR
ncbi:hypothetical protein BJ742DRAFT_872323 [Cladochytrium replicatum]|nr:hypothetical protein BJ742DRAFT_872323 [Cladochytrium replicatum]